MLAQPTCLVVDDSDVVRKVMRHALEELGYGVLDVASGAAAVAACRASMPSLLVLDWHMPGSQSLEILSSIRAMRSAQALKILYVMTDNEPAEIDRALAAGAHDVLIKPFRCVTLKRKITAMTTRMRTAADMETEVSIPRFKLAGAA